jgi:FdhD protein
MSTITHSIVRYKEGTLSTVDDVLAVEEPLEISLQYEQNGILHQKTVSITMRTPGDDAALVAGFLFTEGILSSSADIETIFQTDENRCCVVIKKGTSLDLSALERHFYTTSSCGVCGKSSIEAIRTLKQNYRSEASMRFKTTDLLSLNQKVTEHQIVFGRTGGLHASALFSEDGHCLHVAEDVGRHNALDKLIGAQFLAGNVPLTRNLLFLSGRASFELIQKAAMAEIPVVCALGAPSSLALDLARASHMTLIGFLKPQSFNIYCGAERVV